MCRLPFSIGIMKIEIRSCWTIQLQSLPLDHIDFFFFSPFHIVFSLTPFYLFFVTENLFPNVNVVHPNCFNKVDFLFELENESKRWTMCLQRWLPSCIFQHLLSFDNFCANEGATFVNLTKFDLCWQMAEWPLEAQLWFTPRGNDQHLSQVLLTWTYDSSS